MKTVIMVAEKPSLAQSIANILSKKTCDYRQEIMKKNPSHSMFLLYQEGFQWSLCCQ